MKWETILNKKNILEQIERALGNSLIGISSFTRSNVTIVIFDAEGVITLAKWLKSNDFSFECMFYSDLGDCIELNYQFSLDYLTQQRKFVFRTEINKNKSQASITSFFPTARYWQGLIFHHHSLNFHSLDSKFHKKEQMDLYRPIKIDSYTQSSADIVDKFSIFHPIHKGRNYFHAQIYEHSKIKRFKLTDGWLYKNIQVELNKTILNQTDYNPVAHLFIDHMIDFDLGYDLLLEKVFQLKISLKIRYIRTFLSEIQRIIHHLAWFQEMAYILNLKTKAKKISKLNKVLNDALVSKLELDIGKTRIPFRSAPDIQGKKAKALVNDFNYIIPRILKNLGSFTQNSSVTANLKGFGIISKKEAVRSGLTGPNLRASGINLDIRERYPYLSYLSGPLSQKWAVAIGDNGDCYSRVLIRYNEIKQSLSLCSEILSGLAEYKNLLKKTADTSKLEIPLSSEFTQFIETSRGTMGLYLKTSKNAQILTPQIFRLFSPDQQNYAAFNTPKLFRGEEIRDFPILLHSLNIYFPLVDL